MKFRVTSVLLLTLALAISIPASAGTLWYNGDADGINSFINQNDSNFVQVLYNDFVVPSGPGWIINYVWSNNIFTNGVPTSTTATWEIRSNMPTGTLVASGSGAATLTATGANVSGFAEYSVEVSGLNVILGSGTYWLAVYPNNSNGGLVGNDTTSGANAVGTPPGNNGNLFFSTNGGASFAGPVGFDTSAGVGGTVVPEPGSLALLGTGVLGLAGVIRRKLF